MRILNSIISFLSILSTIKCSDISSAVFGNVLDGMPAAFGDFNSDELTDVFVIREKGKLVQIMLAADQEPLLRLSKNLSCYFHEEITNVVPGDFDGDVFMDVLVTTLNKYDKLTSVYILWGSNGDLSCHNVSHPILEMRGQPLSIDYNHDMIIDLFGIDKDNKRMFWIFNQNRTNPTAIEMRIADSKIRTEISSPHSNAFLDINNDFIPDLLVTTKKNFEVWYGNRTEGFYFDHNIDYPYNYSKDDFPGHIGQSLYIDAESIGRINLVLPLCFDVLCKNSTILIYSEEWFDLHINFKDTNNIIWGFVPEKDGMYTETITLRGGDFNLDGYPDLLATLGSSAQQTRTLLLLNVPCIHCKFKRTFEVQWNALSPFYNNSIMAVFYDFYQDGVLDVILVTNDNIKKEYRTAAFKNSLDYDANFVKVMVLTGLTNSMYPISPGTLGKKKRTYGTNLPGPSVAYKTTTQDGSPRSGIAAQLPQSAHYSMNLPYTTFGLGRTPNFVDFLIIGVSFM